ncbi:MAG: N-acetylmuramoyl-L-alanine amidase [Coriobacteriia bacterium]|nr:N-acetylmuramoyl-L-alanine amidase [Coriobacteriia bacterium]
MNHPHRARFSSLYLAAITLAALALMAGQAIATEDPLTAPVSATTVAASSVPTPSASPTASAAAPLIVIDPGHGGPFSNANANGLKEKNVNLALALRLRDALVKRGYRVLMTRQTDRALSLTDTFTWGYSATRGTWAFARDGRANPRGDIPRDDLQARANVANTAGADLFISVHANGSVKRTVRGYETFASGRDALGRSLSKVVQRRVIARTKMVDRGAKTADFYVLRWTNMPAILLEAGFITNKADAALLRNPSFLAKMADGVASGVDEWMRTRPYRATTARLGGTTTSEHAASLSRRQYPAGAPVAVLARSDEWADAPGAAALAAALGGPMLWTSASGPDATTTAELARLAPQRIVVVGIDTATTTRNASLAATAAKLPRNAADTLIASHSAALSASIATSVGVPPTGLIFVASAEDTRALLAAAPIAAYRRAPLLLATNGALSLEGAAFLSANRALIKRVILVGPTTRVPTGIAGGLPTTRHSASAFATLASSLNAATFTERRAGRLRPIVADPRFAPEYLASGVRAASANMPVLPVEGTILPAKTREWITNRRSAIGGFEMHGARGGMPPLVDHLLRKADYL